MVEPTETEGKDVLDRFVDAMLRIADEIEKDPKGMAEAPRDAIVKRLDIVAADRKPILTYGG
jgi:glycine dehydrogenase subunit 2